LGDGLSLWSYWQRNPRRHVLDNCNGSGIGFDITAKTKNFNMNLIVVFGTLTLVNRHSLSGFVKYRNFRKL